MILPLALVGVSLVQEVTDLYVKVKSGEINFGRYFERIVSILPSWITGLLDRFGVVDLPALQAKLDRRPDASAANPSPAAPSTSAARRST